MVLQGSTYFYCKTDVKESVNLSRQVLELQ